MANTNLHKAKKEKNDEFYTQLPDIENELKHYKDQLAGKVVFCNCDDPFESNFFKYFAMNFNQIGLKKLIVTCYYPSPVANTQLSLFGDDVPIKHKGMEKFANHAYKIELDHVSDIDNSGSIGITDVEKMLKNEKAKLKRGNNSSILTYLNGDGDFRSDECVELLKQADVVITNPPFSLFREYLAQLVEYNKKFLIIGSKNAVTYKGVFKLIKAEKIWLGYGFKSGAAYFSVPNPREFASGVYDDKTGLVKFGNLSWYTNLYVDRSENRIIPYLTFEEGRSKGLYPKYDNYDAIEVSKVAEIPADYDGVMGVPITFLDKWVPSCNFQVVKFRKGDDDKDLTYTIDERSEPHTQRRTIQPYFRTLIRYHQGDHTSEHSYGIVGTMYAFSSPKCHVAGTPWTGKVNGKNVFKRILIKRTEIIGLDRYVQGNTMPNKRMHINGKEIYARILIKRTEIIGQSGVDIMLSKGRPYINGKRLYSRLFIKRHEIIGATESEGKGFSNGLWDSRSKVAQPMVNGKRLYRRLFIKPKEIKAEIKDKE
jgi:hypothetical protein